jgi:hypothetical protein
MEENFGDFFGNFLATFLATYWRLFWRQISLCIQNMVAIVYLTDLS